MDLGFERTVIGSIQFKNGNGKLVEKTMYHYKSSVKEFYKSHYKIVG